MYADGYSYQKWFCNSNKKPLYTWYHCERNVFGQWLCDERPTFYDANKIQSRTPYPYALTTLIPIHGFIPKFIHSPILKWNLRKFSVNNIILKKVTNSEMEP
jgi:hypothetical protein